MSSGKRGTRGAACALIAALSLVASPLWAERRPIPGNETVSETAIDVVHDIWSVVRQLRAEPATQTPTQQRSRHTPRAIPPAASDGPTVDLNDLSHPAAIDARLRAFTGNTDDLRVTVVGGQGRLGDFSIGSDQSIDGNLLVLEGNADVYGRLQGNLVAVDGDVVVHPGGVVSGDVLALRGQVRDEGGEIGGEVRTLSAAAAAVVAPISASALALRNLAGVVGVFLTLGALGFGLVLFAQHNLEVVSDTVTHSFGRSFVVGLLSQILLLPTFGMLVVGLILSVAGILLLPFAVAVYALLVIVGIVGGTLAVAHAMGETYTRRRLARGSVGSPNAYRYVAVGLAAPLAFWLAWAAFGWVPYAGDLIRGAAVLVSWILATSGLGATLLSRAGVRENFAGRFIPPEALTDEFLWATPQFGVPAVRRPPKGR